MCKVILTEKQKVICNTVVEEASDAFIFKVVKQQDDGVLAKLINADEEVQLVLAPIKAANNSIITISLDGTVINIEAKAQTGATASDSSPMRKQVSKTVL